MLSFLRSLPGWGEISGSLGSTLVLAAREGGERLNHYSLLQLKSFRHLLSFFLCPNKQSCPPGAVKH